MAAFTLLIVVGMTIGKLISGRNQQNSPVVTISPKATNVHDSNAGNQTDTEENQVPEHIESTLIATPEIVESNEAWNSAYAEILTANKDAIDRYYNWEKWAHGSKLSNIVIADICGDETPELLFIGIYASDNMSGDLYVYTYDGAARVLLISEEIDILANVSFAILLSSNNEFWIRHSASADGPAHDFGKYEKYVYENGALGVSDEMVYDDYMNESYSGAASPKGYFEIRNQEVTKEEFYSEINTLFDNGSLLIGLDEVLSPKAIGYSEAMLLLSHSEQSIPLSGVMDNDFIISDSGTRRLVYADISGLSKEELRLARNEIYARHGRQFKDEKLQAYFNSKTWYHEITKLPLGTELQLSEVEQINIDFIQSYE